MSDSSCILCRNSLLGFMPASCLKPTQIAFLCFQILLRSEGNGMYKASKKVTYGILR